MTRHYHEQLESHSLRVATALDVVRYGIAEEIEELVRLARDFGLDEPTVGEAADFLLAHPQDPLAAWQDELESRRTAKIRALSPVEFRSAWMGKGPDDWDGVGLWRDELILVATDDQLATIAQSDLLPLLADDDGRIRMAAILAFAKVGRDAAHGSPTHARNPDVEVGPAVIEARPKQRRPLRRAARPAS